MQKKKRRTVRSEKIGKYFEYLKNNLPWSERATSVTGLGDDNVRYDWIRAAFKYRLFFIAHASAKTFIRRNWSSHISADIFFLFVCRLKSKFCLFLCSTNRYDMQIQTARTVRKTAQWTQGEMGERTFLSIEDMINIRKFYAKYL